MHRRRTLWWRAATIITVLALGASGCGNDGKEAESPVGKVKQNLEVGSDIPYPPFEFGNPPYRGFDVDVVRAIARRLGTRARFERTSFDHLFGGLARGTFDMVASGTTITPEHQRDADFSVPYAAADQSLLVKRGSGIKTKGDLAGKVVGTQLATPGAEYAKDRTDAESIRSFELIDDAINALEAGQVDAVINDFVLSKYAERSHRDLVVVQSLATGEGYGIAFRKGSGLKPKVDAAIEKIKEDGTYARIFKKWFRTDPP